MARWLRSFDEIADGSPTPGRSGRRAPAQALILILVVVGFLLVVLSAGAEAKQKFLSAFAQEYPAAAGTSLDSCLLCHTDPVHPGEKNLNGYGNDWEDGDLGDKDFLAPALVNRDSDGDGVPNGQEIRQLSLPGDPSSSTPPTTTTTTPGTPPDGQALYAARCAACHGQNGGNLNGTALARAAFVDITLNGQGSMPAQAGLAGAEVGAIWDYVTGSVPTTTTTQPGSTTTTAPASGAAVWAQNCAACHGASGGDVVPTSRTRSQLTSIVNDGQGSMPGFAWLGSTQVNSVADYLLSLSVPQTTIPGATTTTTSPRSGAAVYAASCSSCHGADGGNLRGNSLSLSAINSAVTSGQGTMSGFSGRLSTAETSNVSHYVRSVGASGEVTSTTAAPGSTISGSNLYLQNCSSCHGLHGEGGPGGPVTGIGLSAVELDGIIRNGAGSMPGFAAQMSDGEVAALVAFTESLAAAEEFDTANETTTTAAVSAGESGLQALEPQPPGSNSPLPVLVVSLLAGLIAAGAAVLWARLGRDLTR